MSTVRRRPSIFSYFSFSKQPTAIRYGRSDSVTSNLRHNDPYEKPDRHSSSGESSPGGSMNQGGRSRLFKTVGIVGLILLLLWFFVPNERIETVERVFSDHTHVNLGTNSKPPPSPKVVPPPVVSTDYKDHADVTDTKSNSKSTDKNEGQIATDPDAGTDKCTRSSHFSKPIVQYALMVDAGSTGSRIHVYRFNNCGDTPELESEVFNITQPGLSAYPDDPEAAAASLDVLLDVAVKSVPQSLKSCTPIAVKATAGLRLLGEKKSEKILEAVRHRLETKYPFPVVSTKDGVAIMDGKDEGVYAWITTNYLTKKIGTVDKAPTAAIFDLGGASTQIVFEPTFPSVHGGMPEVMKAGDHKYELTFGGRQFVLYQHSHLGYGLKEARKAIHLQVYTTTKHERGDAFDPKKPIVNPCIAPGMSRTVNVTIDATVDPPKLLEVTMVGPKTPSSTQCRAIAESILKKNEPCTLTPCSFNGIHQPPLARTFAKEDIYIFSYFYDRTVPIGMPSDFTIRELKEVAAKVCAGEGENGEGWESFMATKGALKELRGRPEHCLDLNFMIALLHTGYEMPVDRELKVAKKIGDNELGWCLGASLPLLDQGNGGWKCRVREIQ
ncbi:nucleoside phosphatase family-domain-containing protein [Kalaharituber pfeilii]|nr:nucleoside phosphatase family-domain-containing protein [Kalaharituber pfeilii]